MQIAGFLKNSFVDYPGHIACVVFALGCNMNCWYCHNAHLLTHHEDITEAEVFNFLKQRKGMIEGVVVSGGEPTLQADLPEFIKRIKGMGYKVKLDTNGTNFALLRGLIAAQLIDFVAMDIKAPFEKYKKITGTDDDIESIKASVSLLMQNKVDYEFRTTFSPDLTLDDLEQIAKNVAGAKKFVIQKYNIPPQKVVMAERPIADYQAALERAKKYVKNTSLRGV